jgi:hypothetical protein
MPPAYTWQVSELDKMRLFIYIPWTKSGLLTLFTYTLTGLFTNNVFSFYALSYSDTSLADVDGDGDLDPVDGVYFGQPVRTIYTIHAIHTQYTIYYIQWMECTSDRRYYILYICILYTYISTILYIYSILYTIYYIPPYPPQSKPGVTSSGDNTTGAGEGDDETLIVNLSQVPKGVTTLAFCVNIYTENMSFLNVKVSGDVLCLAQYQIVCNMYIHIQHTIIDTIVLTNYTNDAYIPGRMPMCVCSKRTPNMSSPGTHSV